MSPRLRLINDMCDASAVLGNTNAHSYVGCDATAVAAEIAETGIICTLQSLGGEEGIGVVALVWMFETRCPVYLSTQDGHTQTQVRLKNNIIVFSHQVRPDTSNENSIFLDRFKARHRQTAPHRALVRCHADEGRCSQQWQSRTVQ